MEFDVIVIGTGAGGGPAVDTFIKKGFKTAVIERGDWINQNGIDYTDELDGILKKGNIPLKEDFPIELEDDTAAGFSLKNRSWTNHALGGTTLLWYGHLLRLQKEDFQMKNLFENHIGAKGADLADWPIHYSDFENWYTDIEKRLQVFTPSYKTDATNTLNPPLSYNEADYFLYTKLQSLGYNPFQTPSCLGGHAFDLRPINPINNQRVEGAGIHFRKNSANSFILPHVEKSNMHLFANTIATKIMYKKGRVSGVTALNTHSKKEMVLHAPVVVVACNAIESSMLFLRSAIPDPYNLNGKYLTYLTDCTGQCILPYKRNNEKVLQEILGTLSIKDFYLINDKSEPLLFKGGKIAVTDRWYEKPPISFAVKTEGWGNEWKNKISKHRDFYTIHFSFKGENMPLSTNKVSIGQTKDKWNMEVAKVAYNLHNHDVLLANYIGEKIKKIALDIGAEESEIVIQPRTVGQAGHGHQHGTLRFGTDASTSVLNPNCESHHIKGLYVTDGSFMPTSGGLNSSLTIMANAARVADCITKN